MFMIEITETTMGKKDIGGDWTQVRTDDEAERTGEKRTAILHTRNKS